ncbi:unnamed protein product [Toxocara canis]|uniref:Uncharacterized protein n=1 Tax=Toxocara canis TaxID=6265 RepID=A0A183VGP6_TOXCA|nr:unnamed protein product [Toxocara canis]
MLSFDLEELNLFAAELCYYAYRHLLVGVNYLAIFKHYANEYEHLTKVNREMDAMDKQGNSTDGEPNAAADQASSPKIEGPILIEFQSEPEEDDDDDKNDFHL